MNEAPSKKNEFYVFKVDGKKVEAESWDKFRSFYIFPRTEQFNVRDYPKLDRQNQPGADQPQDLSPDAAKDWAKDQFMSNPVFPAGAKLYWDRKDKGSLICQKN